MPNFSSGADSALAAATLHPQALSRVIALNGQADPMAPLDHVSTLITTLRKSGAQNEHLLRPGGQGIGQSNLAAAKDCLTQALKD